LTRSSRAVFPFKEINHLADLASHHFAAVYDDASATLGELKQRRPLRFDDGVEHDQPRGQLRDRNRHARVAKHPNR
jgi:hypothetical protein